MFTLIYVWQLIIIYNKHELLIFKTPNQELFNTKQPCFVFSSNTQRQRVHSESPGMGAPDTGGFSQMNSDGWVCLWGKLTRVCASVYQWGKLTRVCVCVCVCVCVWRGDFF